MCLIFSLKESYLKEEVRYTYLKEIYRNGNPQLETTCSLTTYIDT